MADYSSKPAQGELFAKQRNIIQGITAEDFPMHKAWYERTLRKYDLWDEEESDLVDI